MSIWKWSNGRKQTGYEKLRIISLWFFDCYILRFRKGALIPKHRDPVADKSHYRLNIILKNAKAGGEFHCANCIIDWWRIKLFRPDKFKHSVSEVTEGTRYVLSIGWAF